MAIVRLTQIDAPKSKDVSPVFPNLALMKLAHWHRARGDEVVFTNSVFKDLFEPDHYDHVYGSAVFDVSCDRVSQFRREWPNAIASGTGTADDGGITVESIIGTPLWQYEYYDYSIYPEVKASFGFASRGCRLNCKFCGVQRKEGKIVSVNSIANIWRGQPWPKKIHLLDNDFFGNPEWRARIAEIREGAFRVCMSQGINIRLIDDEVAEALASLRVEKTSKSGKVKKTWLFQEAGFKKTCLYTAWDNLGDEAIFFRGVDTLEHAGVPARHLMAYMLVGFDPSETWDKIWHRFDRMVERGIRPYPMVYDKARTDLVAFQRWVISGLYRTTTWLEYRRETKSAESVAAFKRSRLGPSSHPGNPAP